MIDYTPAIDARSGVLVVEDGQLVGASSVAMGLLVWTLRTTLGRCPVAPDLGVDWSKAQVNTTGAGVALQKELERAVQWIVDGGWMRNVTVTVTAIDTRLTYEIAFEPPDGAERRRVRGTVRAGN